MARDLYGEMLGRALTRQAPPGHMPAYITPGEAQQLRAVGGGVTPGGGQVMAGGIPAFPAPGTTGFYKSVGGRWAAPPRAGPRTGFDQRAHAMASPIRGSDQPLGNLAPGIPIPGTDMFTRDPGVLEDFTAAGEALERQDFVRRQNELTAAIEAFESAWEPGVGESVPLGDAAAAAAPAPRSDTAGPYTVDPTKSNAENQVANLRAAANNPEYYDSANQRWTDAGAALLPKNISEGGLGRWSPGATLLANNREAPAGVVAHVMQQSPRRGQGAAIFDPRGNVSVPPGYNMGLGPSALMTLGGLAAGGPAGAAITGMQLAARAPGLGRWIGDKWIEQELPGSGLIEWKRDLQEKVGLGGIRDSDREALAEILSGVGTGAERAPQPFQQPSWYTGEAQFASAMPESDELLLEAEEAAAAEAEEPFTSEVPADLLARLDENAASGLLRLQQAGLA